MPSCCLILGRRWQACSATTPHARSFVALQLRGALLSNRSDAGCLQMQATQPSTVRCRPVAEECVEDRASTTRTLKLKVSSDVVQHVSNSPCYVHPSTPGVRSVTRMTYRTAQSAATWNVHHSPEVRSHQPCLSCLNKAAHKVCTT